LHPTPNEDGTDGWRVVAEYPFGPNLRKVRYQHARIGSRKEAKETCVWEHLRKVFGTLQGGRKNPVYLNRIARERDQLESAIGFEGENKAEAAGNSVIRILHKRPDG